jgi:intracellular sulfur oxidation DsrE/DsrF family protein
MNRNEHARITDEQLNAYIDDELEFEERKQVFEQLEQDQHLTHEAQELRQLRAMLRHAYRNPPPAPNRAAFNPGTRLSLKGLAAGSLLALGVMTGWYGNEQLMDNAEVVVANNAVHVNTVAATNGSLLLHISSNDPARMELALDYAEQQLAAHRDSDKPFRVEVLANDGGIEMLRRDTSPFPRRIEAMLRDYDNVSFLACANALRKLRESGVMVELLPGTQSDHSAINEIVKRLEGGWRYLKV